MQHQMIILSRNQMRDVCLTYLTADGYRSHTGFATSFQSFADARAQAIARLETEMDEDGLQLQEMNVLSVDAWRDGDSWTWNAWYKRGTVTVREFSRLGSRTRADIRRTLAWFRDEGYIYGAKGKVALEDDGYNLVVLDRHTREPFIAIEYGPVLG